MRMGLGIFLLVVGAILTFALRVDVSAIGSPLESLRFATLRIKDGIVDRYRDRTGTSRDDNADRTWIAGRANRWRYRRTRCAVLGQVRVSRQQPGH